MEKTIEKIKAKYEVDDAYHALVCVAFRAMGAMSALKDSESVPEWVKQTARDISESEEKARDKYKAAQASEKNL